MSQSAPFRNGRFKWTTTCVTLLVFVVLSILLQAHTLVSLSKSMNAFQAVFVRRRDTLSLVEEDDSVIHLTNESAKRSSDVVYAHVHMARTAGTTLNGEMASRYRYVCGNKGYSYDFYQYMERLARAVESNTSTVARIHDRGRVPKEVMKEIGFEECDWISLEDPARIWNQFSNWPVPIEMHVPCRDPIDHLMSQCNFIPLRRTSSIHLDCSNMGNLRKQVRNCLIHMNRFSSRLLRVSNFRVKCFNSSHIEGYVNYMEKLLQPRRMQRPYIHRSRNQARNKTEECIWTNEKFRTATEEFLLETAEYYQFCRDCMGSENELPLPI